MKKWWKRLQKNHKGFTLVELICTIAIFSIVISGVGSAMVISARSYRNGNVELDLQQQAQITSNLLTNLILDANSNVKTLEPIEANGSQLIVRQIESDVTVTYEVYLDGNQLMYRKDSGTPQILAEHVTGFAVSNNAGNDNVDFTLQFTEGGKTYESDYHVTPRNGITVGGASLFDPVGIYAENKLILEPGQTYDLNVRVTGTSIQGFSIQNLTGNTDTTGTTVSVVDTRTARITVGTGETGTGSSASFRFQVVTDDGSAASQDVEVLVRRVNGVSLTGYKTDNRTYKVVANITGTNLEKELGSWWDINYINPYVVRWEYTPNDDLFSVSFVDDPIQPYAIVTLRRALEQGDSISLSAYAVHPEGEYPANMWRNKASAEASSKISYATVMDTWTLAYGGWGRMGTINFGLTENVDNFISYNEWTGIPYFDTSLCSIKLSIKGISSDGTILDQPGDFEYGTGKGTGGFLSVTDKEEWGDVIYDYENWTIALNPHDVDPSHADEADRYMAYSSPYLELPAGHTVPSKPYEATNPIDTGLPLTDYNTNNFGFWKDIVKYVFVKETKDKYGTITTSEIEIDIEDVAILYKNTSSASDAWKRDNHVFVTKADSIEDYRVYFYFDKGWSEDNSEYYFDNLDRFVGVIYDDPDDKNELRYDLPVSQSPATESVNYLTFRLNSTTKNNAYESAKEHDGIIKEIYEYNPYLGYLWTDPDGSGEPCYPQAPGAEGPRATKEQLASVTGCEGTIIFHIVDPNIYGCDAAEQPKVMYCPTQNEIGSNLYYIDDSTRYHIVSDVLAYYEEWDGAHWRSKLTFNWDTALGGWQKVENVEHIN